MKKLLQTLYLAVALIGVTPAHADMVAMGAGTVSCRQYQSDVKAGGYATATTYFAWAQGFMTATNLVRLTNGKTTKDLNSIDLPEQMRELDDYCVAHPNKNYSEGIPSVFNSLDDSTDAPSGDNDE